MWASAFTVVSVTETGQGRVSGFRRAIRQALGSGNSLWLCSPGVIRAVQW